MKTQGKVTSSDGTSIAYERAGTGPALILVDAALNFRGFRPMGPLDEHLRSHFSVITYDRRGRGESTDTAPYAVDREVDDLRALIEAAGGSAFVYGFSSGGVLALHAAARGLAIPKLALFEPPLPEEDPAPPQDDVAAEVADLVAAGRRGEAVEHVLTATGVPPELLAEMRQAPYWPELETVVHTFGYDAAVTSSLRLAQLAAITTPTLVLASEGSDEPLPQWAARFAELLPNATLRTLPGGWHGVPVQDLAPVLTEFFIGR